MSNDNTPCCAICHEETQPLYTDSCNCRGSIGYIHSQCAIPANSDANEFGYAMKRCTVCNQHRVGVLVVPGTLRRFLQECNYFIVGRYLTGFKLLVVLWLIHLVLLLLSCLALLQIARFCVIPSGDPFIDTFQEYVSTFVFIAYLYNVDRRHSTLKTRPIIPLIEYSLSVCYVLILIMKLLVGRVVLVVLSWYIESTEFMIGLALLFACLSARTTFTYMGDIVSSFDLPLRMYMIKGITYRLLTGDECYEAIRLNPTHRIWTGTRPVYIWESL